MINLSPFVLLMPLLGFIILGLVGRALPRSLILAVAWGACGRAFLFATISFFSMLGTPVANRTSDLVLYTWVSSNDPQAPLLISFVFSSRRRHTRFDCDWSSDVCSSD